jgi:hypothetical protein
MTTFLLRTRDCERLCGQKATPRWTIVGRATQHEDKLGAAERRLPAALWSYFSRVLDDIRFALCSLRMRLKSDLIPVSHIFRGHASEANGP